MQPQPTKLVALLGLSAALLIALAPASTTAQSRERTRHIDGSSAASFEASVTSLQNEMSAGRREDFDAALAIIWVANTVDPDFDDDGDMDSDDMRLLVQDADDLLTDIRRGNVVSAVEDRAKSGAEYTPADYFKQLDGLSYDEVLRLAGRPSAESYRSAVERFGSNDQCSQGEWSGSRVRLMQCARSSGASGQVLDMAVGKALNDAIMALNVQDYAAARTAVGRLSLSRLSPYERSKTEQILFFISYGEGQYAEARQHLEDSIAAGGLNAQELEDVLLRKRFIDTQLAAGHP